ERKYLALLGAKDQPVAVDQRRRLGAAAQYHAPDAAAVGRAKGDHLAPGIGHAVALEYGRVDSPVGTGGGRRGQPTDPLLPDGATATAIDRSQQGIVAQHVEPAATEHGRELEQ